MFPRSELLWHTLAQRELNGLSTIDCTVDFTGLIKSETGHKNEDSKLPLSQFKKMKIEDLSSPPQHTLKKRIELCAQIYESAGRTVNTSKMWNYYINAMLELNSDLSTQSGNKRSALKRAFELADEHQQMSADHYIQYIQLLSTQDKDTPNRISAIYKVFENATRKYDKSLQIWSFCMRFHIQENDFNRVHDVFMKAHRLLGDDCADLWHLYMVYLRSSRSAAAHIEFDKCINALAKRKHSNFNVLKAQMLELLAVTVNMKKARKTYELFVERFPDCYDMHDRMAELEAMQVIY